MTTYIALLRGVNLGASRRVSMADLRDLLAKNGYEGAKTHLQSGNVVLPGITTTRAELSTDLERLMADRFGMTIRVVLRTAAEMAGVIKRNPLDEVPDPARYYVYFLDGTPDRKRLVEIDPGKYEPDRFWVSGREIYVSYPNGLHKSKLTMAVWERTGVLATARNWNTVLKLHQLSRA